MKSKKITKQFTNYLEKKEQKTPRKWFRSFLKKKNINLSQGEEDAAFKKWQKG
ncbi:MAG TPA: hypothetical protein PK643_00335 [Saprospiraceae bacterium]|nr:hypothetical protein [Saprospiraceae bacterium]